MYNYIYYGYWVPIQNQIMITSVLHLSLGERWQAILDTMQPWRGWRGCNETDGCAVLGGKLQQ